MVLHACVFLNIFVVVFLLLIAVVVPFVILFCALSKCKVSADEDHNMVLADLQAALVANLVQSFSYA
jgi:hypothetical protein